MSLVSLSFPARSTLFLMGLLVIPFSWNAAVAQVGEWIKADTDPAGSPSSRIVHGMAYDETRGVVILHGGHSARNETWEWNGDTRSWSMVADDGPNLGAFDIAYDPVRDVLVLSGGAYAREFGYCETWEWDHRSWKLVANEETSAIYPAMAYHPQRKTVIRHGGFFTEKYVSTPTTWEWDGHQWKSLPDGPSLSKHRMVYDSSRNKMVVFGGLKELGVISNETWEFDGETWTKVAESGPEGRDHFGMVFDVGRGVTVLFGGGLIEEEGFKNSSFSDMWQWDGKVWTPIQTETPADPDKNFGINMAYDARHLQTVLFGGSFGDGVNYRPNDTWLFTFQASGIPQSLWTLF